MQEKSLKLEKQVHLPFKRAFEIALKNIRMRLGRSLVTSAGIMLGIAFLATVLTQGELIRALQEERTVDAVVRERWLVVLALMMSTIGITNSMLMSVTERFKEIGTFKCLGALDWFVVEMFILEGMMMGVLASGIGSLVGILIIVVQAGFSEGWSVVGQVGFMPYLRIFVGCMLLGGVLTLLSTLWPARRAAKMPPAAALRVEI